MIIARVPRQSPLCTFSICGPPVVVDLIFPQGRTRSEALHRQRAFIDPGSTASPKILVFVTPQSLRMPIEIQHNCHLIGSTAPNIYVYPSYWPTLRPPLSAVSAHRLHLEVARILGPSRCHPPFFGLDLSRRHFVHLGVFNINRK